MSENVRVRVCLEDKQKYFFADTDCKTPLSMFLFGLYFLHLEINTEHKAKNPFSSTKINFQLDAGECSHKIREHRDAELPGKLQVSSVTVANC